MYVCAFLCMYVHVHAYVCLLQQDSGASGNHHDSSVPIMSVYTYGHHDNHTLHVYYVCISEIHAGSEVWCGCGGIQLNCCLVCNYGGYIQLCYNNSTAACEAYRYICVHNKLATPVSLYRPRVTST